MVEVIRTVKVKLDVPDSRRSDLHETAQQFRYCANEASKWAWNYPQEYCVTSKREAEDALYDRLYSETEIHANQVQKAIRRAITAVKSGVERIKQGDDTSRPEFSAWSIVYDKRSAQFYRDRVSLYTTDGRFEVDYVLPDDPQGTPIGDYLLNDNFEFRTSTLQYDRTDDEFYLHARMKRMEDDNEMPSQSGDPENAEHQTVLGVDLNVDGHLAVTSTGSFIKNADSVNHRRRELKKTQRSLERTGTRSAHLTIQKLENREERWARNVLHRASNDIVTEAIKHGCTHIAFEDLTGIVDNLPNSKRFHTWAFRKLLTFVEYKSEERGISVSEVNPAYTSQRCSKCGHTEQSNRPSKHEFQCSDCGYELDADYNAAKNIARKLTKYLHSGQKSSSGGASCQYALASGTMTVSGIYTPTEPSSAEQEFADKSAAADADS